MDTTSSHPVVVGLDRSPQAWAAVEYAAALAERHGQPLLLLHAYDPTQYAGRTMSAGTRTPTASRATWPSASSPTCRTS